MYASVCAYVNRPTRISCVCTSSFSRRVFGNQFHWTVAHTYRDIIGLSNSLLLQLSVSLFVSVWRSDCVCLTAFCTSLIYFLLFHDLGLLQSSASSWSSFSVSFSYSFSYFKFNSSFSFYFFSNVSTNFYSSSSSYFSNFYSSFFFYYSYNFFSTFSSSYLSYPTSPTLPPPNSSPTFI